MHFDQVLPVVQIGDQLGDNQSASFAKQMAAKLLETNWDDVDQYDAIQLLFLSLNANLKALVLQEVRRSKQQLSVSRSWPIAMQLVCSSQAPHVNIVSYKPSRGLL